MEENFSDSTSAVLDRNEEDAPACEFCGEFTEARKQSCPDCLMENNPEAEILSMEYLIDHIESLDINWFSPDHEDEEEEEEMPSFSGLEEGDEYEEYDEDEEEEESDELSTSRTARFNGKPARARNSSGPSERSSSKNINVKKSMAKIKHEKQAKLIIYSLYALITILFFGVLIWKFQTLWDLIKGIIGI
ncbi:MAG: hypothetical protein ACYTFY_07520 [Planctomycetota bacterium]|jgi:hypothetical protein